MLQSTHSVQFYHFLGRFLPNRTLPQIADEDIEAIFYALDDSGDFKVSHNFHIPS